MFLKEKITKNSSGIKSCLWKSRVLEAPQLPENFITSLFIYFLFQNLCSNLISTIYIGQSQAKLTQNLFKSIIFFIVGLYELDSSQNEKLYSAITIFFSVYLITFFGILTHMFYMMLKQRQVPEFSRAIYSYLKKLHVYIFALPLNNYMYKLILSAPDYGIMIGAILVAILSLGITYISIRSDLEFINQSVLTRTNNFFFWFIFAHATITGIYFGFLMGSELDEIHQFFIFTDFALNLTGIGCYIYFVSFLSKTVEKLTIFFLSARLSVSSSNLNVSNYNSVEGFNYQNLIIFVLILLILIFKLAQICLSDDIPTLILDTKTLFIKNDYWHVRRIVNFFELIRSSEHKLDKLKKEYEKDKLLVFSNQENYVVRGSNNEISESFIKSLLHLAEKKFTNSDLIMCIVKILMQADSHFFETYSLVQKMSKREKDPIKAVGFLILKSQIEEKYFNIKNDSGDCKLMKRFLESMLNEEKLTKMIETFMTHQNKLYQLLHLYSPDLLEISHVVSVLLQQQTQIQEYWNSIPTFNRNLNPELLKIYAEFIRPFDEVFYKNFLISYRTLKNNLLSKDHKHYFDSEIDINSKTMHMLISLDSQSFGKLILFSQNISQILKNSEEKINCKNIKHLLPFSLQESIESKIQNLNSNLDQNEKVEPQPLFLMTSDGYMKAFREYSKILSIEHFGLCKFSLLESHKEKLEYMLIDSSGHIESYTKTISNDLFMDKLSRLSLRSLSEKAATHFSCFVKEISTSNKFYIRLPRNKYWAYSCEIIESGVQNVFLIKAEKKKIKSISIDELDLEDEDDSCYDIAHEYTDEELKTVPSGNSSNLQVASQPEFKEEAKKSMVQTSHILSQVSSEDLKSSNEDSSIEMSMPQSSVNTSQSYLEQKKVELKDTLGSLKFYKFSEKYIPIVSATIFVGIYLFVIMYSYYTSTKVIDEVNQRVYLFNQVSLRVRYTLETCRNAIVNEFYQDIYPDGYTRQVSNYAAMLERISNLAKYNNNILTALGDTNDQDLQGRFFEKNVKVFYDDFTEIYNTDKFYVENSFTATNMLINEADILYKMAFTNGEYQTYVQEYIMTNGFNYLLIENEKLFDFLMENISSKIDQISQQEIQFLVLTIVFLVFCIISTLAVLYNSYRKTNKYLSTFIDPSNNFLVDFMKNLNQQQIKKDLFKSKEKSRSKKNELRSYKSPHSKKLLASFMIKMAYVLVALIIPMILLIKNHFTIARADTRIRTTMKDVYSFNKIKIYSYYSIILQLDVFAFNQGYSLSLKNSENFPIIIQKLSQLVSTKESFSSEALTFLNEDVCKYYLVHPTRPNCDKLSNGIAHGGIIQTMFAVQTYLRNLQQGIVAANGNLSLLVPFMIDSKYVDNFFLVSNGINPATEYFQSLMIDHLISDLNRTSCDILMLFIAGVVIGILIMIVVVYTIWFLVGGDRTKIVQLMTLVPQEYLVRNREVKCYLIKQSDEATKYLKSIEKKNEPK